MKIAAKVAKAALAAVILVSATAPVWADGGAGGSGEAGRNPPGPAALGTPGVGGADGQPGGSGSSIPANAAPGGGGGGAGGGLGGSGGTSVPVGGSTSGNGGTGGNGGANGQTAATLNNTGAILGGAGNTGGTGGAGTGGFNGGGGGGGGSGGHGLVLTGSGASSNSSTIAGGTGGVGGTGGTSSGNDGGNGGSGGDGGAGVKISGSSASFSNNGAISGGNGGAGGAGSGGSLFAGRGGSGGAGGSGVAVSGSGATITNSGMITGGNGAIAGAFGGTGCTTSCAQPSQPSPPGGPGAGGTGITGSGLNVINTGAISGGLSADGTTRANALSFTGGFNTLTLSGGWSLTGGIDVGGTLAFNQTSAVTLSNVISGTGNIIQNAPGTLTLSGANAYTGTTSVVGGVLAVNGSIAASSLTSVQSGGTLIGTGTVGATQVNAGGIFAPGSGTAGTSMIVSGNLAFQSGAVYLVQINPTSASFANVNGIATLGGATVNAVFAPGSYVEKRYTILSTTGGVSGTFAPTVATTNLPSNFRTQLNYDGGHAFLDLTLGSASGVGNGGLNANQSAVNNAITGFFNSNGSIPGVFGSLTPAGLTQASGENATAVQQSTFSAMSQFINLLTGPFFSHEGGVTGDAPNAPAYADDSLDANAYAGAKSSTTVNDAYGLFTKTPLRRAYDPRWSVWAAGFGGTQQSDGNAVTGSNNASSTVFGTAVGLNYFLSPDTLVGFALGGGGTRFAVTGFGNGRSDLFQTGLFVRHATGAAYVSAALGYGWQDVTTDRTVTIAGADRLRAEFNANAWTGRVETGYRFVAPLIGLGITPYAAGQSTALVLPGYAEQVVSGAQTFALGYNAKTVIDSRTELGVRTDRTIALVDAALVLRGRFAWVHDFNPDRSVAAAFQTLPGAGFVVAGAAQAPNSALAALSAQVTWLNGWSAATSFEADASSVTRSYAGKAVVRAVW